VTYNHHGDKIEEISEDESRDYNLDDRGQLSDTPVAERASRSEARFEYEYDARGNWTKKVVAGRSGVDAPFTVSTIERRTLVYE
jgi:hypothetical protein